MAEAEDLRERERNAMPQVIKDNEFPDVLDQMDAASTVLKGYK